MKNLADFIKGSVTIATEKKKKFIEAIEDRKKKGGGRDMFSSYDEKRRTPAGKHKDSSLHMCELWGEAGYAWPSRDAGEVNKARLYGTRENVVKRRTHGQEVCLKQHIQTHEGDSLKSSPRCQTQN